MSIDAVLFIAFCAISSISSHEQYYLASLSPSLSRHVVPVARCIDGSPSIGWWMERQSDYHTVFVSLRFGVKIPVDW